MGTILDTRLRQPRVVRVPGVPREVGAILAMQACSATIIEKRRDGVWCYGSELDIDVWPLKYHERALAPRETLLWTGMEIKLEANGDNRRWKHKHLVAALTRPVSQNWFAYAAFRPPLHRGSARVLEGVREAFHREREQRKSPGAGAPANAVASVMGESALPEALRALRYDPFETSREWLTARLPDPLRFRWADVEPVTENYSLARNPNYRDGPKPPRKKDAQKEDGHRTGRPLWSFGVCAELTAARDEIRQEALANPRLWEMPGRPGGPHSRALEVVDTLLDASIWQALAGRPGGDRAVPVVNRVIRYVHDHMENASKRFD
jgi:hypothetical protein